MLILLMLMHGYNAGTQERNQLLCGDCPAAWLQSLISSRRYFCWNSFVGIFYIHNEIIRVKTFVSFVDLYTFYFLSCILSCPVG